MLFFYIGLVIFRFFLNNLFCASRCLWRRVAREDLVQQKRRRFGANGWASSSTFGWVFWIYYNYKFFVRFFNDLFLFYLSSYYNLYTNISHASFGQSASIRKIHTSNAIQVPDCSTAQRRTARLRTDKRLHLVAITSIQEAGLQKLPKHLSTVVHSSFVQHTVSIKIATEPHITFTHSLIHDFVYLFHRTTLSEDFLKTAFENNTFTVKDFKFFPLVIDLYCYLLHNICIPSRLIFNRMAFYISVKTAKWHLFKWNPWRKPSPHLS